MQSGWRRSRQRSTCRRGRRRCPVARPRPPARRRSVRATRSKSRPAASNGAMSRANRPTPTVPAAGGDATQWTTATRSPTSDCSCGSIAVYEYHGVDGHGDAVRRHRRPAAASPAGMAARPAGTPDPGGNGGFSTMYSASSARASSMSNCAVGRRRPGGRPPDRRPARRPTPDGRDAAPTRDPVGHRQIPSAACVWRSGDAVGSMPLRTWKSTTAASVSGP